MAKARALDKRRKSIRNILSEEAVTDPTAVFVDLVYAIETAIELGLTLVITVMPLFQELYGLKRELDAGTVPKLESLRDRLRKLILVQGEL